MSNRENREKIENFCKDKGLKLLHCNFVTSFERTHVDYCYVSYWVVRIEINGKVEEYTSLGYKTVAEGVDGMLERIQEDIDNPDEEG